jgi:hypothetical protein
MPSQQVDDGIGFIHVREELHRHDLFSGHLFTIAATRDDVGKRLAPLPGGATDVLLASASIRGHAVPADHRSHGSLLLNAGVTL